MWTKQHQAFCGKCSRNTNHVTHYQMDGVGGSLVADVACAEHRDISLTFDEQASAVWTPSTKPAA